MARISFGALLCRKKKLDDSSRLDVVEIARVPDMLPSLFPSWSDWRLISTPVVKQENKQLIVLLRMHLISSQSNKIKYYKRQTTESSIYSYPYTSCFLPPADIMTWYKWTFMSSFVGLTTTETPAGGRLVSKPVKLQLSPSVSCWMVSFTIRTGYPEATNSLTRSRSPAINSRSPVPI